MSYRVLPTKEFSKDFRKIDSEAQKRIKMKVNEAAENRTRYKHLHYDLKNSCRIRIGKLRVIFSYSTKKKEMYLEKIVFDHRYR